MFYEDDEVMAGGELQEETDEMDEAEGTDDADADADEEEDDM